METASNVCKLFFEFSSLVTVTFTVSVCASRYSAGLNGFTAEGDHLPLPVEDTAEVAEARAAFMAYMIELMAEQQHEEQQGIIQSNAFLEDGDDVEVIEGASRKRRAPEARNGYYQRDEMESRSGSGGMVDFSHDDFEDQLAMPSMGAMSYREGSD